MASGKVLRQLIRAGAEGDLAAFKVASQFIIEEERQKQHHLLANDLERLLYGDRMKTPAQSRKLHAVSTLPANKDSGLDLLETRPVIREGKRLGLGRHQQVTA